MRRRATRAGAGTVRRPAAEDAGNDFVQTAAPDLLFNDVSLDTETISTPVADCNVHHQAIATACAGPALRI